MKIRSRLLLASVVLAALALGVLAATARADKQSQNRAATVLHNANGDQVGHATFTQDGGRMEVRVTVHNLPAGFHGFHVHAVGVCTAPSFSSAGGHLGSLSGQMHPHHAGDLSSLLVNHDGTGEAMMITDRFTIANLTQPGGTALIIHALPDNFANIPARYNATFNVNNPDSTTLKTGDSGARIACGVIHVDIFDNDSADVIPPIFLQSLSTFLSFAKVPTRSLNAATTLQAF